MNFLAVSVISAAVFPPPVKAPPAPTATQPALIHSLTFSRLTPPVGMCLFAVESFAKVGLWKLAYECLPYLLAILAVTVAEKLLEGGWITLVITALLVAVCLAIHHHYDVSNAFYKLFLDERMVYTCAYFTQDHDDLERAQTDKLEMICRKLRLEPGMRVLDIGSSRELCGGTHVSRTGDIGLFKITVEAGVAAGVRRVEAVTGDNALALVQQQQAMLDVAAAAFKAPVGEVPGKIAQVLENVRALEKELARLKAAGIRGIKLHPDFQSFWLDDPRLLPIFETAQKDFVFEIHIGDKTTPDKNPSCPYKLASIMRQFPDMRVIAAHFGGYRMWSHALDVFAGSKFENLWFDTSSTTPFATPELAHRLLNTFPRERILFGTDWPLYDPVEELERLQTLGGLSDSEMEVIMSNASALLAPNNDSVKSQRGH